jgi:bromodomain-containing factor 1
MDISTVTDKLNAGQYTRAKDFESDIKLIIANCFRFNPTGNPVRAMGESFQRLFNELWAKKDQYIIDHTPAVQSPSINGDSEDESEEEEDDEEPVAAGAAAAASVASMRLIEEQTKLITLMANKKTDPNILKMQQDMVEFLKSKIEETPALPAKKAKKSKPAKGAKKSAPAKKPAQSTKKGGPRKKQLNTIEKEIISRGIGRLPDEAAADVIEMIREVNPEVVNVGFIYNFTLIGLTLNHRTLMERWNWILIPSRSLFSGRSMI